MNTKKVEALGYASGSADREGAVIDTKGYAGVLILVHFATIAAGAVTSIKAQQGAAADLSDAADLAGTAQSIADDDDDKVFWIDLKASERYVRVVVDKDATNATAESAVAVLYGAYGVDLPIADTDGETHSEPAEGTA